MRKYVHSVGYALSGFVHAVTSERNFPWFLAAYVLTLIVGLWLRLDLLQLALVLFSGGTFLAIELLNTALERLADAFDAHTRMQDDVHHQAIRRTKDVAAAAALVSILVWLGVVLLIMGPDLLSLLNVK